MIRSAKQLLELTPVFITHPRHYSQQIAANFAEFVERHLADDSDVLFPKQRPA